MRDEQAEKKPTRPERSEVWTVPNVLSGIRLVGSPLLLLIAWIDKPGAFVWVFLALLMTDWVDGKLAKLLKQETTFGARLDSYADATFYACTLVATFWLEWDQIRPELLWIGLAAGSYTVNACVALRRFRRVPTYHTRLAKTSWLLIGIAIAALFLSDVTWPLRVAMISVLVTNLEQIAISFVIPRIQVNVTSVFHALHDKRRERDRKKPPC